MRSLLFLTLFFGFSGPAIADSEVFKIDLSAESYNNILSGTDRNGSVSGERSCSYSEERRQNYF